MADEDIVLTMDECVDVFKIMQTPKGLLGYACSKMERRLPTDDGYVLHFHSAGWLRPWKKQIWIESLRNKTYAKLTYEQAAYVAVNHPDTYEIAIHWLVQVFNLTHLDVVLLKEEG